MALTENAYSINRILEREHIAEQIKQLLLSFDANCNDIHFKKGIYIYGSPGCGKTQFVVDILKEINYDIVKYDAGDVRNKTLIDTITSNNMSNCNVLHMMKGVSKKIAIIMDEIDGMNNGDKGGITSLIKLIRQKKTKKQKMECKTMNPIICIGNYYIDKKIKELIKVCNVFELKTPTHSQMLQLLERSVPTIVNSDGFAGIKDLLLEHMQGDLRKLDFICNLCIKKPDLMSAENVSKIFQTKSFSEDTKKITQHLINTPIPLGDHNTFMNETDRTTVALLWHENIVDMLGKVNREKAFPFYLRILENMCFADYTDRITFQNQIWQFNEMSSLIKTFYNNKLYHDAFPLHRGRFQPDEVRFTKVLTKYSTEYNNLLFIYNLCQELDMDKKDLISFYQELRLYYGRHFMEDAERLNEVEGLFENHNISRLDIKRMYRYLDKNVKKEMAQEEEESIAEDDE